MAEKRDIWYIKYSVPLVLASVALLGLRWRLVSGQHELTAQQLAEINERRDKEDSLLSEFLAHKFDPPQKETSQPGRDGQDPVRMIYASIDHGPFLIMRIKDPALSLSNSAFQFARTLEGRCLKPRDDTAHSAKNVCSSTVELEKDDLQAILKCPKPADTVDRDGVSFHKPPANLIVVCGNAEHCNSANADVKLVSALSGASRPIAEVTDIAWPAGHCTEGRAVAMDQIRFNKVYLMTREAPQ